MSIPILITEEEYKWAEEVAVARRTGGGNEDTWAHDSNDRMYEAEIMGAAGELAFAKWLGVEWEASVNRFRDNGDVCGIEVRTSRRETAKVGLKVKKWEAERNPSLRVVWMVRDREDYKKYWFVGWTYAGRAPKLGRLHDPSHGKNTKKAEAWFLRKLKKPETIKG